MTAARPPDTPAGDGVEIDTGRPIGEIASLEFDPGAGFLRKVRNRIQRRVFGVHVLEFGWAAPALLFMAFIEIIFGMFGTAGADKGDSD